MCLYLDNHSISTISENELVYLPTGDTYRPDRFLTITELAANNVLWQLLMLEVEPRVESWIKLYQQNQPIYIRFCSDNYDVGDQSMAVRTISVPASSAAYFI